MAISSMEPGLELCLNLIVFDETETLCKVDYGLFELHESSPDHSKVKVIQAFIWFQLNSPFKLLQSLPNLVEIHHAVSSVRVVLGLFLVKADGCSKIIHSFLILPNGHENRTSLGMILGMCWSLLVGGWALQICNCLSESVNSRQSILSNLGPLVFFECLLSEPIRLFGMLLPHDLISMVCGFLVFACPDGWLLLVGLLHQLYSYAKL